MKLLIKQAQVADPTSSLNGQIVDIFIENGRISRIGPSLPVSADETISIPNLFVSPGWVDVFAHFGDPGYEQKETLASGAAAAAAGGYTDVLIIPNTKPCLHDKAGIEYIVQTGRTLPVTIHPLGAITRNTAGTELAEMYDMKASGAKAFTDGLNCIQEAGLLVKALQYVKAFDGLLVQLPDDRGINPHGLMNEGIISTQLGLPGKPAMAEELIVARDLKLARYAASKIHFTGISTAKSLEYIQRARQSGTSVSCSVTPQHLFFCDEDLQGYDTNLKSDPPLRTTVDRAALRKALEEGAIDCIATHHLPHELDSKVVEFEYAKPGMIGLQTSFAAINSVVSIHPEKWATLLSINPRRLFGLDPASVKEGTTACLTLFNPHQKWTLDAAAIKSRSCNSPFIGKELTGKPLGIINGNNILLS